MNNLCTLITIVFCVSGTSARLYFPEENNLNFKRYEIFKMTQGNKVVNLLKDEVTVRVTLDDMTYYLYTKHNEDTPHNIRGRQIETLSTLPHFDPSKRTIFVIHGWFDDHGADLNRMVKKAILSKYDANVIVVDWSPVAKQTYSTARNAVSNIGRFVAEFINNMMNIYDITGSQITLIGHSLGAHISGNAGAHTKQKVSQIIGLDPAGPAFTVDDTENRLDPSDAEYVQVIHTNGRLLGFSSSMGHADYYPNGGMVQAGCGLDLVGSCSHARAFQYLAEAISGRRFTSTLCSSYSNYQHNKCANNRKAYMGLLDVDRSVVGDFFLETNTAEPFSKG